MAKKSNQQLGSKPVNVGPLMKTGAGGLEGTAGVKGNPRPFYDAPHMMPIYKKQWARNKGSEPDPVSNR